MAKQSSMQELEELHKLVTKSYTSRIQQDLDDNIPTDAATLSGAVKFLKDNCVTADPAAADDLADLRRTLSEAASRRRSNVVSLAGDDLDIMEA